MEGPTPARNTRYFLLYTYMSRCKLTAPSSLACYYLSITGSDKEIAELVSSLLPDRLDYLLCLVYSCTEVAATFWHSGVLAIWEARPHCQLPAAASYCHLRIPFQTNKLVLGQTPELNKYETIAMAACLFCRIIKGIISIRRM